MATSCCAQNADANASGYRRKSRQSQNAYRFVKESQADPWVVTAREKRNVKPAFAQVEKNLHRRLRVPCCSG